MLGVRFLDLLQRWYLPDTTTIVGDGSTRSWSTNGSLKLETWLRCNSIQLCWALISVQRLYLYQDIICELLLFVLGTMKGYFRKDHKLARFWIMVWETTTELGWCKFIYEKNWIRNRCIVEVQMRLKCHWMQNNHREKIEPGGPNMEIFRLQHWWCVMA